MATVRNLREQHGFPSSWTSRRVLNEVIRLYVPGGRGVIDAMTRLHEYMSGQPRPPHPTLQASFDALRDAHTAMAAHIKSTPGGYPPLAAREGRTP